MNPVCFSQILGNENIKRQLNCMLSKKAIRHALLFAGPEGVGKSLFAQVLAARVLSEYEENDQRHLSKVQAGKHPDVHIYRPEGKLGLHSIQALRQLGEEVHLPPYEASWKVFIIHEAERMLSYSANALLKTFEEPPPRTLIILLSRSHSTLLPTILSRCCTLHFQVLSDSLVQEYLTQNYSLDDFTLANRVFQAQGSIGRAVRIVERKDASRSRVLNLLAQKPFQDYRALQEEIHVLSEQVEIVRKQVEESAKDEFHRLYADQLSHQYHQGLEKELEGLTALTLAQEAQALFEYILSWYRDIHLLLLGGSPSLLMNPDFHSDMTQALQRGEFKPFEQVYQAVEETYLSLQRSTSLSICLENLFLKIDRI